MESFGRTLGQSGFAESSDEGEQKFLRVGSNGIVVRVPELGDQGLNFSGINGKAREVEASRRDKGLIKVMSPFRDRISELLVGNSEFRGFLQHSRGSGEGVSFRKT